jgi:hypothetical protein
LSNSLELEVERIGMNAVIPFESIGLFLPMKKGGTAKSTPFVLLLDERSFFIVSYRYFLRRKKNGEQ